MAMSIFGSTLDELQQLCVSEGWPRFVARQLCEWMYAKRATSFDQMTNLSLKVRARLNEISSLDYNYPVDCQTSSDGTKKYLFQETATLPDGSQATHYVEAVFIPDGDRATLCVSCQMGCKMNCSFCVTGRGGYHGSLSTAQILNQLFAIPESQRLTNVVYMGMGEPMDNYDSVLRSTQVLTSEWGLAWSPQRITVSSVGILPRLRQFINESRCHIAVSLHNPFSDERLALMPAERAFPIASVIAMLKEYDWTGQRRISFEYTMFGGLNDTLRHAEGLVDLLHGLRCRVNLIRFHASPLTPYHTSSPQTIARFQDYLNAHGITCTLRASRGEDIQAACGLLAGTGEQH
ncbi:MAG: 23S rRNA (adenine(2503)-C(2))-methyltransferase RlmN [Bacteroidales bacterium]|nr:23S rRNA (adenine(2503)-C(2))-methyltransferase RlmN [Bacteroidales bacterium]